MSVELLHGAEEEVEVGLQEGVQVFLADFGDGGVFVASGIALAVVVELTALPVELLQRALAAIGIFRQ